MNKLAALPSPWTANQPRNLNSRNAMKLTLTIDMDNAAFEDAPGLEAWRIIASRERHIKTIDRNDLGTVFPLMDVNGNRVG